MNIENGRLISIFIYYLLFRRLMHVCTQYIFICAKELYLSVKGTL